MDATIEIQQQDTEYNVSILGELTIYSVAELKPKLLDCLEKSQALDIRLEQLEELDTAGLQLLLLLKQEAKRQNKTCRMAAPSPPIRDIFSLLDLDRLIVSHTH